MKKLLKILAALVVAGFIGIIGFVAYCLVDLPSINSLSDYNPKQTSYVYTQDGEVLGFFASERRIVVDIKELPPHVVKAFLAAEDAKFYEHEGLNYTAIIRAFIKNFMGSHQGASTITQQTVKNMILGPEHSMRRKVREAVLSKRLEDNLTKDEILHVYLNQIYFGNGVYGIEEASQLYFNCPAKDMTIKEAAMLASVPKHPVKYNPLADTEAMERRHKWVLDQMAANKFITEKEAEQAKKAKIEHPGKVAYGNYPLFKEPASGGYYVEWVRRFMEAKFCTKIENNNDITEIDLDALTEISDDETNFEKMREYCKRLDDLEKERRLFEDGVKIYVVMDSRFQRYAEKAFQEELENYSRRQGWKGPIWRLEVDQYKEAMEGAHQVFENHLNRWKTFYHEPPTKTGKPVWDLANMRTPDFKNLTTIRHKMILRPLVVGESYVGIVTSIDEGAKKATVDLGGALGTIQFNKSLDWTKSRSIGQLLSQGDVIKVKVLKHTFNKQKSASFDLKESMVPGTVSKLVEEEILDLELIPQPKANGALISMDPERGWVKAMVGGYDPAGVGFNRAVQAKRQPGSTFKPIVYTAGIDSRAITPATMCADTPVVFRDKYTGKDWRPENSEDGVYDGDIRYRIGLAKSKNICSIKLVDQITPAKVINMARIMGIKSKLPENLTIALGTGEITPLELVTAYSTLAGGGQRPTPIFVRKVLSRDGKTLFEQDVELTEAVDPSVAYVVSNMMQSVIKEGTGRRALVLNRELSGKTGTTNNSRSVWFGGFVPDLATVIYVGNDNNKPLRGASGSSIPLPIFVNYMKQLQDILPERHFERPEGVEVVNIDPDSGKLAHPGNERWIEEVFLKGTAPTEYASDGTGDIYTDDDMDEPAEEKAVEEPYYDEPI